MRWRTLCSAKWEKRPAAFAEEAAEAAEAAEGA
jgi:hypothetical protein